MENNLHTDIQTFLLQVAILLFFARLFGQFFIKIGQPAVIGEILAGVLLGPSCFGFFFPEIASNFLPTTPTQDNFLECLSLIGILFLLFVTGLEIDIDLIRRKLRTAIGIALGGGLLLPLTSGFIIGYFFIPVELYKKPEYQTLTACFFAIAMGISAIPVIARVLIDLKLTRRDVSQTLFAAAMIDDTVGWILLSAVIGLAGSGSLDLSTVTSSLGSVLILSLLSFTIGKFFVSRILDFLFSHGQSNSMLSYTICLLFLWGWFSQSLHLEALFGAFILGIVFSLTPKLNSEDLHLIETITSQFLAPLFFALAGLKIHLYSLNTSELLFLSGFTLIVAILSKFAGVYIGARTLGKSSHWPAIFYATGLNARGSMGVIVASIGLSLGVLTTELYAVLVLMAVITSIMAPPALRFAVEKITPEDEEKQRLEREELESTSILSTFKRVLIPLRPRSRDLQKIYSVNEIDVYLRLQKKKEIEGTILSIHNENEVSETQKFLENLGKNINGLKKKLLDTSGSSPQDLILDEVKKGYDLMILGVADNKSKTSRAIFSPLVDNVIRMSSCPVILVQGKLPDMESSHGTRVLVPTGGSMSAKHATELSFLFLQNPLSQLHLLKVVEEQNDFSNNSIKKRQLYFGKQILSELSQFANAHDINTKTQLLVGPDPETVILETIVRQEIDLLILGTRIRPVGERLYLGPRIEKLLKEANCPVVIFNT